MKVADRHTNANFRKNTPFFYHMQRGEQGEVRYKLLVKLKAHNGTNGPAARKAGGFPLRRRKDRSVEFAFLGLLADDTEACRNR
jgi:hypothetical protein